MIFKKVEHPKFPEYHNSKKQVIAYSNETCIDYVPLGYEKMFSYLGGGSIDKKDSKDD